MKPCMRFIRVSADDDMVVLRVEICDGASLFTNQIYVGHDQLRVTLTGLDAFKDQYNAETFHIRFGKFGAGYASGALDAQLQHGSRGKILISAFAQSEFSQFQDSKVAGEATLYLMSELALLDDFVRAWRELSEGRGDRADLEAIQWNYL